MLFLHIDCKSSSESAAKETFKVLGGNKVSVATEKSRETRVEHGPRLVAVDDLPRHFRPSRLSLVPRRKNFFCSKLKTALLSHSSHVDADFLRCRRQEGGGTKRSCSTATTSSARSACESRNSNPRLKCSHEHRTALASSHSINTPYNSCPYQRTSRSFPACRESFHHPLNVAKLGGTNHA